MTMSLLRVAANEREERERSKSRRMGTRWCPGRDLNPHSPCGETDFKSVASADFATRAELIPLYLHNARRFGRFYLWGNWWDHRILGPGCCHSFDGALDEFRRWMNVSLAYRHGAVAHQTHDREGVRSVLPESGPKGMPKAMQNEFRQLQ